MGNCRRWISGLLTFIASLFESSLQVAEDELRHSQEKYL